MQRLPNYSFASCTHSEYRCIYKAVPCFKVIEIKGQWYALRCMGHTILTAVAANNQQLLLSLSSSLLLFTPGSIDFKG